MPLRVSLVRLGGAGLLGVMLAAPLVLLFLQYEPLSFNIHKPGAAQSVATDPQWGLLTGWFRHFQDPPSASGRVSGTGSASRSGFRARCDVRPNGTKRLHTWLFFGLGAAVLLKIYEFRVLDWVGRLPVVEQIVFPAFAPPVASFAFAVLRGSVCRSCVARSPGEAIPDTSRGVVRAAPVFIRTGDRWSVITSAPGTHLARGGAVVCCSPPLRSLPSFSAGRPVGGARLPPRSSDRRRTLRARPVLDLREASRSFRRSRWMTYVRTALGTGPHSRVFGLDAKLYPNTAGALGLQDIRALDALYVERYRRYVKTFIAPRVFDRFTGTELPVMFRDNPMFDALR